LRLLLTVFIISIQKEKYKTERKKEVVNG